MTEARRTSTPLTILVGLLAALLVVLEPAAAAQAQTLGGAPRTHRVRHFQNGGFQHLRWSAVDGATSYQIFVKSAAYDQPLPEQWTLLKSVHGTRTTIYVRRGQTRQFGVRAVGSPAGSAYEVTGVSSFGTISRPPRVRGLRGVRRWQVVRNDRLYRGLAMQTRTPGASLRLRRAKGTSAVRFVAETGRQMGTVDVYVGRALLRSIDLGHRRHRYRTQFRVPVRPSRNGTVRVTTTSNRLVRISALGQTRRSTRATSEPAAPAAYPAATSFTFTGSGWGHGVGLSQYGAQAMAASGAGTTEILQHYYTGTQVASRGWNPLLDVNVGYHRASTTARLLGLGSGASLEVCAMSRGSCVRRAVVQDPTADQSTAGRVTLFRHNGRVRARVRDENGVVNRVTGARIRLRWSGTSYLQGSGAASVLRLGDGHEYRHGELLVFPYGTGRINDVVREHLENYLLGVAEMPSSWEPAALQAQAIIARTYALKDGGALREGCHCNLRNSVIDQNYTGWAKESEGSGGYYGQRWVSAVRGTAGQVVTYDGQLASTYYFSSSGGHTLNSQDVWSATVPYLQSVNDPWSLSSNNPNASWTATLSQARVRRVFGFPVHALRVTASYDGGAMESVTAISEDGQAYTITHKADQMRALFGLKSDWVDSISESY
ncbi:MAG TPA: SpoIID/LytB domain-containing protein [Nocardioidaceae bacterium]|nr:SpoIID/LytB domain-containing protein [Nocardioidaceae bacterium]